MPDTPANLPAPDGRYEVTWTMHLDADDHGHAARLAHEVLTDPDNTASFLLVVDTTTGERHTIDALAGGRIPWMPPQPGPAWSLVEVRQGDIDVSDSPGCQTAVVNWDDIGDDFAAAEVVLDLLDDDTNLPDRVVAGIRDTISEVWPVEVRQRALKELAYSYGIEESDVDTDDPARYALVEHNVGDSSPPYFVTTHSSPAEAGKYHVEQEYASDWEVDALVDLDTGQTFSAEVQPITFVPIEGT